MPYGSPTSDSGSAVYGTTVNRVGEPEFFFSVTYQAVGTDGFTEQERDIMFQEFIDFIDQSADWELGGSVVKSYPTSEQITPTP